MSFVIYKVSFSSKGFHPEIIGTSQAETAIDALREKGFTNTLGNRCVIEFNTVFNFPTKWVEALNPDERFWSNSGEQNV